MKIRELGKAIGDFEINNIPGLIKKLTKFVLLGIYLVVRLVVNKLWYLYFGAWFWQLWITSVKTVKPYNGWQKSYYLLEGFYIDKGVPAGLIFVVVLFFMLRMIVKKIAPFFE